MREIEFRAWDKVSERMYLDLYGFEFFVYENEKDGLYKDMIRLISAEIDENFILDRIVLMQYTGLKDRNGKKIFEGDILTHLGIQWIISWGENGEGWSGYDIDSLEAQSSEIIGNIYEKEA